MPLIDANADLSENDLSGFDCVIVGAGAVGIGMSVLLANRGMRVLLLESGHFEADEDRQTLNVLEETGKKLGNARWTRKRILGGTTTAWGGQSLRFSELDFANRPWLQQDEWPISYTDLAPYYIHANRLMGLKELPADTDADRHLGASNVRLDKEKIRLEFSRWAPEPNFLRKHWRTLKEKVCVLYNAHLLRIHLSDGQVSSLDISNFRDREMSIPVPRVVICAGGIESIRILLLNDHQVPGGLGSQGGYLGYGFMEHPCMTVGHIETDNELLLHKCLGNRVHRGNRYSPKLSASGSWQAERRRANVSAGIVWRFDDPQVDVMSRLANGLRSKSLSKVLGLARHAPSLLTGFKSVVIDGFVYKAGAIPTVAMVAEQLPDTSSRISLSDSLRDQFGQKLARLHWQISRITWVSMVDFANTLQKEVERCGLGRLILKDFVKFEEPEWEKRLSDVNHHMGGTRMSKFSSDGVVDSNLQVWGARNLFVCGGSVFPTGSHSNPTLTSLALAVRLAEHISSPAR